jgi:para-nitrobenzyl esterase
MSGASVAGGPIGAEATLAKAEASGVQLQQEMKAQHIADLRQVSWDKVLAAGQQARLRFGPSIDGYYLLDTPQHIFEKGQQNDVAVVTGSTANDIGTNVPVRSAKSLAEYRTLAQQSYGAASGEFLKLWPAKDGRSAAHKADEVGRNSGFGLGARNWARMQALTGKSPSYLFMVTRVQPFTPGVKFSDFDPATAGAYHMGDVPYFLGTYDAFNLFRTTRNWTDLDRSLSDRMQDVIVTFARTGNPNTPAVKFVRYDPNNEQRTDFGDTISVEKLNSRGLDFLLAHPPAPAPAPASEQRPRQTF